MRQKISQKVSTPSTFAPFSPFRRITYWIVIVVIVVAGEAAVMNAWARFSSEALLERASQLAQRNQNAQARMEALQAATLNPRNGYALFRIATSDFAEGTAAEKQKRAQVSLSKALPYMPHLPNLLRLLGQSSYYTGNYVEAVGILDRFFRMVPDPTVANDQLHLIRASAHFRTGQQGIAALPLVIAANRGQNQYDLFSAVILNALVLEQRNTIAATIRALPTTATAAQINNKQLQELFSAARALNKTGWLTDAILESVKAEKFNSHLAKLLVSMYIQSRELDRASEVISQIQQATPSDPDIWLMSGDVEFQRGNIEQARVFYRRHLEAAPNSPAKADLKAKLGGNL